LAAGSEIGCQPFDKSLISQQEEAYSKQYFYGMHAGLRVPAILPIVANAATAGALMACYTFPRLYRYHHVASLSFSRGVCTVNTVMIASGLLQMVTSAHLWWHLRPCITAVVLLALSNLFKFIFLMVSMTGLALHVLALLLTTAGILLTNSY
jgi:hypothetical protein